MSLQDRLANIREGGKSEKHRGPRLTPWRYVVEVIDEMRRVSWPKRDQVVKGTVQVIVVSIIFVIILGGLDIVFKGGLNILIGDQNAPAETNLEVDTHGGAVPDGDTLDPLNLPDGIPPPPGLEETIKGEESN